MRTGLFLTLFLFNSVVFAKSSFCTTEAFEAFEKIKLNTGSYKLTSSSYEYPNYLELHIENYFDPSGRENYKIDTRVSVQQEGLDYWLVGIDGQKKNIPETDAGHTRLRIDCEEGHLHISYYVGFWSRLFEIRKETIYDPITNEPIPNGLVLLVYEESDPFGYTSQYYEFAPVKSSVF